MESLIYPFQGGFSILFPVTGRPGDVRALSRVLRLYARHTRLDSSDRFHVCDRRSRKFCQF